LAHKASSNFSLEDRLTWMARVCMFNLETYDRVAVTDAVVNKWFVDVGARLYEVRHPITSPHKSLVKTEDCQDHSRLTFDQPSATSSSRPPISRL
jgi:hypothetical protein